MSKYLDGPGLAHLWKKMQAYVNEQYEWGNVQAEQGTTGGRTASGRTE